MYVFVLRQDSLSFWKIIDIEIFIYLEKESEPADLSKKILFRPSKKNDKEGSAGVSKNTPIFEKSKSTKQERESSSKLSFYQEDEEEEEDDH